MRIVFLITVIKSRGEAYLALKAAQDIKASGGECRFLVMPEVSEFIEDNGFPVDTLTVRKEENKKIVEELLEKFKPQAFIYASYQNLNLGIGIGKVFEPEWVRDKKIPEATFDPENYDRKLKKVSSGPIIDREYRLMPMPKNMKVLSTDFKENLRSPENTLFYKFEVETSPKPELKKKFNWDDQKVIVFPVSRWIYDNTVLFGSSYYKEFLPNLITHYISQLKEPVKICVIGEKNIFVGEKWGNLQVEHIPVIEIKEYEERLAAADLLLTDNGMSGSIEIATQVETPVLVLKNSLSATMKKDKLNVEASFKISGFVEDIMRRMLEENSKAIFPFAIYPLGWWGIVENIFKNNPLHNTFCEVELFNEQTSVEFLERMLEDAELKNKIFNLQKVYKQKQGSFSSFSEITKLIS